MSTPDGVPASARPWFCRASGAALVGALAALLVFREAAEVAGIGLGFTSEAFAALACVGDCDDNLDISAEEFRLGVEIALGRAARDQCSPFDFHPDNSVTIEELVLAVRAKSEGCERLPCSPALIETNQRVVGLLVAGDCNSGTFQGSYSDFYRFTALAGDHVSIRLSAGFDTYLALTQPGGERLTSDNCPGDGLNSCIPDDAPLGGLMLLPADGEYVVEVTSFSLGAAGAYALTVTVQQGPTRTPTVTSTVTQTRTITPTPTHTPTPSLTRTPTRTLPPTSTLTFTPTHTLALTATSTLTPSVTVTRTPPPTGTPTEFSPLVVAGRCRRPGPSGLVPCVAGRMVEVWRCDDSTCLAPDASKYKLGESPISGGSGAFSVVVNNLALGSRPMLVEAEASLAPATLYRVLDIGSLGGGLAGGRAAAAMLGNDGSLGEGANGGGATAGMLEIDPSSEGAMRALDADPNPLGLDAFSNDDIQNLVELTRAAAGSYAGETAEQAAEEARAIASNLGAPRILSFVSASGQHTYHALSSGAFAHHFTTLSATASLESRTCASTASVLAAGAVSALLQGADLVLKSPIVPSQEVVFDPSAGGNSGRVCVGASCLSDASCPPGANDCQVFSHDQNSTPINIGSPGVPVAQAVLVPSNALCTLDENAFAFGSSSPTIQIAINGQKPSDGFTLPASSTIVFAQPTQMGGAYLFGVGGFRLLHGVSVTGAVADVDQGTIPGAATPTATLTPSASAAATQTRTRTATVSATVPATQTAIPTSSPTASTTRTGTFTATRTSTPTNTAPTSTSTAAPSSTRTPSVTASFTATTTASRTLTPTIAPTSSATPTLASTATFTRTATATRTATLARTSTPSPSPSATQTQTGTITATRTSTLTRTPTASPSPSATRTQTGTTTATRTATFTRTQTATRTATLTRTVTLTPTSTGTPTPTPTRTSTRTITSTRTVTPTSPPFLLAHISTDRGCIEMLNNPVYGIGEAIQILYQVDGSVAQAQVTITDFPPNSGGTVILSAARSTNQTFAINATVGPPMGTEALVIQATSPGLSSQAQCSFHVIEVDECATACDCPTGQRCTDSMGPLACEMGPDPIYCCSSGPCPMGETCQEVGGGFFPCP